MGGGGGNHRQPDHGRARVIRGSIKTGKLADITVIDRNLLEIDPKEILDMEIEMTIVDGEVVYERAVGG